MVFGGFGSDFQEVWGNASLVFGNSPLHAFENNRAAKMNTNSYKLQWAIPLEALVASLRAVLFFIL